MIKDLTDFRKTVETGVDPRLTIHSDSLDIKKTERDTLLCLCLLLITSSSEVSLFKRFISMNNN